MTTAAQAPRLPATLSERVALAVAERNNEQWARIEAAIEDVFGPGLETERLAGSDRMFVRCGGYNFSLSDFDERLIVIPPFAELTRSYIEVRKPEDLHGYDLSKWPFAPRPVTTVRKPWWREVWDNFWDALP